MSNPQDVSIKLNLGCGTSKIPGFINIDCEESVKPDIVHDFTKVTLPYPSGSVDQICLFHTIEHISRFHHINIFNEIFRVLKTGAPFWMSYPEFSECYKRWSTNHLGDKKFWEACMFGRQLYPSDFHVVPMHTPDLKIVLEDCGFTSIICGPEPPPNEFNTVVKCVKGSVSPKNYEDIVAEAQEEFSLVKA